MEWLIQIELDPELNSVNMPRLTRAILTMLPAPCFRDASLKLTYIQYEVSVRGNCWKVEGTVLSMVNILHDSRITQHRTLPKLLLHTKLSSNELLMATPRVLLLGGHGKIAQLLTPLLLAKRWNVTSVIRDPSQREEILELAVNQEGKLEVLVSSLEQVKSDVDAKSVLDQVQPDYVVWSAGR